jgi:predicted ferric reductase
LNLLSKRAGLWNKKFSKRVKYMPMEQETMGMLIGGFSIILGITFIVVLLLLFSKKREEFRLAYGLVVVHLVFFSWAVSEGLNAITFDVNHPMAAGEISLRLGIAGVLWAISMIFLVLGLIKFSFSQRTNVETTYKKS